MEPRALRKLAVACFVVAGAAAGGWWLWGRPSADATAPTGPGVLSRDDAPVERIAPEGTRIRVEVLNTTDVRGLARKATFYLRDAGFDVVRFAGEGPARDSTLILDRSGHPEWAELVSKAMGNARVESIPDSSRYVDVTVLLGRTWRLPTKALYP